MFKKESDALVDPFPVKLDTGPFLAAQSERIENKRDIDDNLVLSTLGEVPEKVGTSLDYFLHDTGRDDRFGEDGIGRTVLSVVRIGFFNARFKKQFYDPLDGDPLVAYHLDRDELSRSQKEDIYGVTDAYYKYLTEVSGPESEKKVGRHALLAVKEHGRRAAPAEPLPVPTKKELQNG